MCRIWDYNNGERLWEDEHDKRASVLNCEGGSIAVSRWRCRSGPDSVHISLCVCVCVCIPGTAGYAMLSCAMLRRRLLFELGQGRAEGLRVP